METLKSQAGLPWWLSGKEAAWNAENAGDMGLIPRLGRSPEGGNGNPLQYSCLENPMDRGAWWAAVHKVSKSWTWLFHFSLSCIGEGNGNPLQCSCLENLRDSGAWWAAIYGVAQSWTWLKRLSSSSSSRVVLFTLWFPHTHTVHTCVINPFLKFSSNFPIWV